jgi:hypothetical protein
VELERLELERDPRTHEKVRGLRFFFVLFEEGLRSLLLLFLSLSLLHCNVAKKKAFFFFLFLCCTAT